MIPENVSTTPDTNLPQDNESNSTPAQTSAEHPLQDRTHSDNIRPQGGKPGATPATHSIQQEVQENLGGTTNLSVEQLKEEGDNNRSAK